jgi:lysozyme family protein
MPSTARSLTVPTAEQTQKGYRTMWRDAAIRPERAALVKGICDRILLPVNRVRYEEVEKLSGVPWFVVAAIHSREASLNFGAVLHNGERIIGTGARTHLVPKGRGPFSTWQAAAVDALTVAPHQLNKVPSWTVERILYEIERYNGWGYIGKVNSPYVWSFTNQYDSGKYVADHVFRHDAVDQQCGCAAVLIQLAAMDPTVRARLNGHDFSPPKDVTDNETRKAKTVAGTSAAGGVATGGGIEGTKAMKASTEQPVPVPSALPPASVSYSIIAAGIMIAVVATVVVTAKKARLAKQFG